MTQIEMARKGVLTDEMRSVAISEGKDPDEIMSLVAQGLIAIPANRNLKKPQIKGVGKDLSIKVNANIGTSSDQVDLDMELSKLKASVEAGADTVMDLSTGGDIGWIRKRITEATPIPLGTVPIYQAAVQTTRDDRGIIHMDPDEIFDVIEQQAREGVDFVTVHCGITTLALERLRAQGRITDIVSRGGAFLATWMLYNKEQNPLYAQFDRLLDIAYEHDVTLSLGDSLRPGCLADATDHAQIEELIVLGQLTKRAWGHNVQVMIEGPGHVPLNQVEMNIQLQKRLCHGAPFYVLGPLVTDIASGHDHIACAIGGAVAGMAGADFLCYVTPAEHLALPGVEDVREGVIASKIAAHAADLARGNKLAWEKDLAMAHARKTLDWDKQIALSLDPRKARAYRENSKPKSEEEACTMCGPFCAIKLVREYFNDSEASGCA
ncbi:MAG: phosphomethylpyrimidine synthase ThiC [Deltaproteobacteria bacterium]|nr:phosphomethylpyrimidine synthase ThiC [Deltaproteobacteria bacterium]